MSFFTLLFIGVLTITGVWAACGRDMIFERPADLMEKLLPRWLCKPLFICPACMASIWGTGIWFYCGGSLRDWPLYVFALCGAMHLVSIHLLQTKK